MPASPGQTPGFPENPFELVFDGFEGINTKPSRPAISPEHAYISDGFMPFGRSNARTLYGIGPGLYTAPAGLTIVMHWFGNLVPAGSSVSVNYCLVFLNDGSVRAVNTATGSPATLAPAGTILNPSPLSIGVSQWGNQYFLLANAPAGGTPPGQTVANGYYIWDGVQLYAAGGLGPEVTISSGGFGYTTPPVVTALGGTGTGATFAATLQSGSVASITVVNPGTGYSFYDVVALGFSGGGGNTTAVITAVLTDGVVTSFVIVDGGSGYTSTTSVAIYGGGGTGATVATANLTISGGAVTAITPTHGGESYQSPPTVVVTDGNNSVAVASIAIMPFGVSGTGIETYQNQVWVINGPRVIFSAPESAVNFATSAGGGAFQSFNSFLKNGFTALRQSNGFLYLLADSSMNYISGVSTSSIPATTTFTNQNVDPQIGTSWPGSVQVFSRNVVFANSFGVHVSYGGAVTKVSDPLDGIYSTVPLPTFTISPSSAVAIIFGIHVYMLLLPVVDQVTRLTTNKLLMWDGKRWWTASQEVEFTWIASQEVNSVMTAWGTDGATIYPLFQNPSASLTKTLTSKLWDEPSYFFRKMANRVFTLLNYNQASSAAVTITVDNGTIGSSTAVAQSAPLLVWTGLTWTGLTWYSGGLSTGAFAVSQPGQLLGLTVQTAAEDLTLISVTAIVQNYQTLL